MTVTTKENTSQQNNTPTPPQSEKEMNFRRQEQMFQRMLAEKEARIAQLEKEHQEKRSPKIVDEDDDNDDLVVKKQLNRKLEGFSQNLRQETQSEIQKAVQMALAEERKQNWLKQNPDFYSVLQHADKFADKDPELAETILSMPEGFERQKLVYKTIKSMNLHMPEQKQSSIQDKIDANRRGPYYQPSGIGTAPYNVAGGDFSESGQKNAYEKMQQLKKQLRM